MSLKSRYPLLKSKESQEAVIKVCSLKYNDTEKADKLAATLSASDRLLILHKVLSSGIDDAVQLLAECSRRKKAKGGKKGTKKWFRAEAKDYSASSDSEFVEEDVSSEKSPAREKISSKCDRKKSKK